MQSQWNSSWLDSGNQSYLDNQFETFLKNPSLLSDEWRRYFQDLLSSNQLYMDVSHADVREFFKNFSYKAQKPPISSLGTLKAEAADSAQKVLSAYRLRGHLQSDTNPLAPQPPRQIPSLDPQRTDLQKIYSGTASIEFMHIDNSVEREWIQQKFEEARSNPIITHNQKAQILELIIAAEGLEKYLGAKYPGAKRYGLEGCDSLIVGLDELISSGSVNGIEEIVIAMTHRGRLNVLVNLLGKIPRELFDQFENRHNILLESGDVKYHQGFSADLQTPNGNVHVSLVFNPSHLEIVTPVAMGSVRARQERRGAKGPSQVLCVSIHGDAAFSGQGIVMESLNMSETRGYGVGGTIHVVVNNQIGFTTSNVNDARSTLYCTDVGKMLSTPIFHVNADDPEAVLMVFNLALEYRIMFQQDVIIDLIGYRRMGHNEADEPAATQPLMYKIIRSHPSVNAIYSEKLIASKDFTQQEIIGLNTAYRDMLDKREQSVIKRLAADKSKSVFATDWRPYSIKDWRVHTPTTVPLEALKTLATKRDTVPDGFVLDPLVHKIVDARTKMTAGEIGIDWGYAETLAYASLLNEGYGVRLSGQDSGRGTFFHRHAVWHEQNTAQTYISLCHLSSQQSSFWVIDSLLSEAGVLAFDYGYSTSEPRTLTLWEAQFGDFANSAQVVIDQFISSGEQKWGRLSGLVMLLPHGYEGQGPEHSSARIERYLQLCAQQNMQVCIPSNPAQIFHLLRRQMLRPMRKPLIVITPKSLLRHRFAISTLSDLAEGEFKVVIPDETTDYNNISRVIICSGKIYYELLEARLKSKQRIALIRLEQLYPFPDQELVAQLHKYIKTKDIIWCQEEPHNQGAWFNMQQYIRDALLPTQQLTYAGREDSAAPSVGYYHLHEQQQQDLIKAAIGEE